MKSRYDENELKALGPYPDWPEELTARVYTSRLLGSEPELVLHGGGNTSVKLMARDLTGREMEVLYVKGSGVDLASIDVGGFCGLDLAALKRLKTLTRLSGREMENQLGINKIQATAPDPSVDTLAHAFLPHRFVDHTHADSILVLTNQEEPERVLSEALGPKVAVLPYKMPGFPLALGLSALYGQNPEAEALVVLGHGIFTYGPDARTAYETMIDYVTRAEEYIRRKTGARSAAAPVGIYDDRDAARLVQTVRGACSHKSDDGQTRRFLAEIRTGEQILAASLSPLAEEMCSSGVLTPDHVIRTKNQAVFIDRIPADDESLMARIREKIIDFTKDYDRYFKVHAHVLAEGVKRLDPYPRVFLVKGLGLIALGATGKQARIAADIAESTFAAKIKSAATGRYKATDPRHVFDLEYWGLQQKKAGLGPTAPSGTGGPGQRRGRGHRPGHRRSHSGRRRRSGPDRHQ